MAVSLAQAKLNTQDALDAMIIDEFRKSSAILDNLIFDQAVNPMGGGATLTYGYHRLVTERGAAFRAINSEYTPAEAAKQRYTIDLKPLGGAFEIDRVLAGVASGAEVSFQMAQLIKSTGAKFADEVINGDTAVDANGFDGLDKALTGTSTELDAATAKDWSDLDTYGYHKALDDLDEFLGVLDGAPTMILGNRQSIAKLRAIARRANQYVERPTDGLADAVTGRPIVRQFYGENVLLVDVGEKPGSSTQIIPVESRDLTGSAFTVTIDATGGTFTLTVTYTVPSTQEVLTDTTSAIAEDADSATVLAALLALDNVASGDVTVTGDGPHLVTFAGDLAAPLDVDLTTTDSTTGGAGVAVAESGTGDTTGLTDLYAVRVGRDGFHAVAMAGVPLMRRWLPDFTTAKAVKTGEVEMGPVATVLKASKAAAVLRNIKVQ